MLSIPRLKARDFAAQLELERPAIFTDLVDDWRAQREWSFEYLRSKFANASVLALHVPAGRVLEPGRAKIPQGRVAFGEFLDSLASGRSDRYVGTPLEPDLSGLAGDIRLPERCARARFVSMRLWVGPAGVTTSLHHDLPDNLFVQVRGRKRVILIPRAQGRDCYRHGALSAVPNFSRVDAENPDFQRFPRFRRVTPLAGEVGPGEALFIPRLWWHHFRSVEPSISLNVWYADGLLALLAGSAQAWARLRARVLRPASG
jgi:hypothetical protein